MMRLVSVFMILSKVLLSPYYFLGILQTLQFSQYTFLYGSFHVQPKGSSVGALLEANLTVFVSYL